MKVKSKKKSCFQNSPITPEFIANSISKHQSKTGIGAHQIFLGQVRADIINDKQVKAIEYTAHQEMADDIFYQIREAAFDKFDLSCMHIYHSLGMVNIGEISLFVFASSTHRKTAQKAIEYLVEEIKAKVPIFGKEIFNDNTHSWKTNN